MSREFVTLTNDPSPVRVRVLLNGHVIASSSMHPNTPCKITVSPDGWMFLPMVTERILFNEPVTIEIG